MNSRFANAFLALTYRDFRLYLSARFLATLAVQMQSVAIGWQVYAITHNTLDLGLIGLAQFLPFVVLVLPAGHVADRLDRKRILALCYAVEVLCAALLLLFTLSGSHVIWPVLAVLVLFGAARAFAMPTSQAMTPNLVPVASFANAVALSSTTMDAATIVGPAIGGLLYTLGPTIVYSTVALALALSVTLMLNVRLPHAIRAKEPAAGTPCSRGCASSAPDPWCSARFRWTCSPCCLAAPPRCCRRSPTTSCTRDRADWACCAPRRPSAPQ